MGGKSGGGGSYTPKIDKIDLESRQGAQILDFISEGVVKGWYYEDDPMKNVFLNDTPVVSESGHVNTKGVEMVFTRGEVKQNYLPGFNTTDISTSVNTKLTTVAPFTRRINNSNINRLRVIIGVSGLIRNTDKGDSFRTSVDVQIDLVKDGRIEFTRNMNITGRTDTNFTRDMEFDVVPESPFDIRVTRLTADSDSEYLKNETVVSSYVEIIAAKFSYPNSAVVGLKLDAELFGNQIPERKYLIRGIEVQIPDVYDPYKRTYSGFWSGRFKKDWTNNPAWIMYDLLTNSRYGLGRKVSAANIDIYSLFAVAKYCDEMVDDGEGGKEPRFTCNVALGDARPAYDIINDLASCFRGMMIWDGSTFRATTDAPQPSRWVVTNANVIDGRFTYSGTDFSALFSAVHVEWVDSKEGYTKKVEYVDNPVAVKAEGLNINRSVAFGTTSRGQAVRVGRWILETNRRERMPVSFEIGKEGMMYRPYDIVDVADNNYSGTSVGGRVVKVAGSVVTLDRELTADFSNSVLSMVDSEGVLKRFTIKSVKGATVTLTESPKVLEYSAWIAKPSKLALRSYRVVGISETANGTYKIDCIQHEADKGKIVDSGDYPWTNNDPVTGGVVNPEVYNFLSRVEGGRVVLTWSSVNPLGRLKFKLNVTRMVPEDFADTRFRDYQTYETVEQSFVLSGLTPAVYRVELTAIAESGRVSLPVTIQFDTSLALRNLRATKALFSSEISWDYTNSILNEAYVQLWESDTAVFDDAINLGKVAVPQTFYTRGGLGLVDKKYIWVKIKDNEDNESDLYGPVIAEADSNPAPILEYLDGQITDTQLGKDLLEQINSGGTAGESAKEALEKAEEALAESNAAKDGLAQEIKDREAAIQKEVADRNAAIKVETTNRNTAIKKETDARVAAIKLLNDGLTQEIIDRKDADGNLQGQITTVKSTTDGNTAAIQAEVTARTKGDEALGKRVDLVAADNGKNSAAILAESEARVTADVALGKRVDATNVNVGKNTSAITAETTARVKGDEALGKRIDTITVQVDKNTAGIVRVDEAIVNLDKSVAEVTESLSAGFNSITGNVFNGLDFPNKWKTQSGANERTSVDGNDFVVGEPDSTTSQFWAGATKQMFPVTKGVAYKISFDVTSVENKQDAQTINGFNGIAKDGVTLVNISGANTTASQHYFGTQKIPTGERRQWFGVAIHPDDAAAFVNKYPDGTKRVAHADVAYLSPTLWLNYSAKTGVVRIHSVVVEVIDVASMQVVDSVNADLTSFKTAQATKDEAMTQQITAATSQAAANKAAITTEATTRANADTALGKRIDAVTATAGKNTASITALDKVVAANDKAQTEQLNTAKSEWLDSITVKDTRNTNEMPSWYYANYPYRVVNEMKNARTIGLDADGYADLQTFVAWRDGTAGDISQTATVGALKRYRYGGAKGKPDVWSEWAAEKLTGTVGVRNYAEDGLFERGMWYFSQSGSAGTATVLDNVVTVQGTTAVWKQWELSTQAGRVGKSDSLALVEPNTEYTLSVEVRTDDAAPKAFSMGLRENRTGGAAAVNHIQSPSILPTATWTRHSVTGTVGTLGDDFSFWRILFIFSQIGSIQYRLPKLEKGAVATDWTPAPEDTKAAVAATNAEITEFKKTQAAADKATAERIDTMTADVDKAKGMALIQTFVEAKNDSVSAQRFIKLQADFESNVALIQTLETVMATENAALSKKIDEVAASVGDDLEAKVTQNTQAIAEVNGKLSATWSVTVETKSDGKRVVGGIALGADGTTGEAQFIVQADKFAVYDTAVRPLFIIAGGKAGFNADLIVNGTILGEHIKANQTLSAPNISGGSINIANGKFRVTTAGAVEIRADATRNVGMKITNDKVEVFDDASKLRVRLGRLS